MSDSARTLLIVAAAFLGGCGDDSAEMLPPPAAACVAPERLVGDGCVPPGVRDNGCPAGMRSLDDGRCVAPGVPPEACAEGFEHDGDAACLPVLPAEPCPVGQMAVPGDSACRPVMDCGTGKWGNIPVDATTQYVDGSFVGTSDGSEASPWTTIGEALAAASAGGTVAVTDGRYAEAIEISDYPVKLWGRCPERVEVAGPAGDVFAIGIVRSTASGAEVHGLAVSTTRVCLGASGVEDVLVDGMWLHDCERRGMSVEDPLGPTSLTLRGSLIEASGEFGVAVAGAAVNIEGSLIRDTQPDAQGEDGQGVAVIVNPTTMVAGALTLRGSVLERNISGGLIVLGAEALVEGSVVRDTRSNLAGENGWGIDIGSDPSLGVPATATIVSTLVERSVEYGIVNFGSDLTVDGTVIRDTALDMGGRRGIGLAMVPDMVTPLPASATLSALLIERSHLAGVFVHGAHATVDGVVIRDTRPSDVWRGGRGMQLQVENETMSPAWADIRGSRIEQSYEVGLSVIGGDAMVDGLLVNTTAPHPSGGYGDGLVVSLSVLGVPSSLTVGASRVEQSGRAGASSYGATLVLESSAFVCQGFDLFSDAFDGVASEIDDLGGNGCGCSEPTATCKRESVGGEPPPPVGGLE